MTEFEQIYREHFDTVYRFLIRLCRNEPLAEELGAATNRWQRSWHRKHFSAPCVRSASSMAAAG